MGGAVNVDYQPSPDEVARKKYVYGAMRNCCICEKAFAPRDKGSPQMCCSHRCRGRLQTQRATRKCEICGRLYVASRPRNKSCSRGCGVVIRLREKPVDPMVAVRRRLAQFCCSVIARCFRNKSDKTAALLGYSVEQLRAHLEAHFKDGMSWANYGKKEGQWSIDHTQPISKFDANTPISEINALTNLRPMWHSKNCSKKNKWAGH